MPKKIMEMKDTYEPLEEGVRPSRRSPLVAGIIILLLIAIGAWVGAKFFSAPAENSKYSAVYLSTGDVYFGELKWFPKPYIANPLYLERGSERVALVPFKDVFWGPGSNLYLNSKEIIFWAKIRSDSPIAEALADPSKLTGAPAPANEDAETDIGTPSEQ